MPARPPLFLGLRPSPPLGGGNFNRPNGGRLGGREAIPKRTRARGVQVEIKHGLISCDSHGQVDRDAFTSRMSRSEWGDRIPEVVEVEDKGERIERWRVNGRMQQGGVVNCPS